MNDYRRIRVLWPDHLALARGKYLPAHLAHRGTRHSMSVFALLYDRDMRPAPGTGVIYEFACHEGNYAIEHTLRGARMQELEASR